MAKWSKEKLALVRSRRRKIITLLMKKGLTDTQAVGIVASLRGENDTFDPKRKQGEGGPAIGIAQWENHPKSKPGEGRQDALKKRKNWDTLEGQVDHIYDEMTGKVPQRISGFKKEFRKTILEGDSATIAKNFTKYFEKPDTSLPSKRQEVGDTGFTAHEIKRGSRADAIHKDFAENHPSQPKIEKKIEKKKDILAPKTGESLDDFDEFLDEDDDAESIMNPGTRRDDTYTPPQSIMDRGKSDDTFSLDQSILGAKSLQ